MSEVKEEKTGSKKPSVKKGSASSEMVIGAAANQIKKSVDMLKGAVDAVNELGTKAENFQALIAQKEDRVKELDVEFSEKKRAAQVNLDLEIKADENKVVTEVLAKNNEVAINTVELSELKARAERSDAEVKADKDKAVAIATSAMKKDHDNAMLLKDAEFKAKEAENLAQISNLKSQVEMYKAQCASWEKALEQERAAGVERSKAASIGTLNVGQPTK